jgi:hypothetical protein
MIMLSCHEVTRLLSESRERPLSLRERFALRVHTLMCAGCRNFARHMNLIGEAMKRFARGDAPSSRE